MDMKSTVAENTEKSLSPRQTEEQTSPLLSMLAAVLQLETPQETGSLGVSTRAVSVCLLSVIMALHREFLSNDLWELSMIQAKKMAMRKGVSEIEIDTVFSKLEEYRKNARSANPLSSMF